MEQAQALAAQAEAAAASATPRLPPLLEAVELAEAADGLPVDEQLLAALREAVAAGQAWEAAAKQCVLPARLLCCSLVPVRACCLWNKGCLLFCDYRAHLPLLSFR